MRIVAVRVIVVVVGLILSTGSQEKVNFIVTVRG